MRIGNGKTSVRVSLAIALGVVLAPVASRADGTGAPGPAAAAAARPAAAGEPAGETQLKLPGPVTTARFLDASLDASWRLDRTLVFPSPGGGTDACWHRYENDRVFVPGRSKPMPLLDLPMNAEASPPAGRWIETLLLDFPATHEKRDEQANGDRPLPGETRSPVAAPVRF